MLGQFWMHFSYFGAVFCPYIHTFYLIGIFSCLLSTVEPSWRKKLLGNRAEKIQTNGPDNIIFMIVKEEYGTKKKHFWVPSAPLPLQLHCSSDERTKQNKKTTCL